MLDLRAVSKLPDELRMQRNGRDFVATKSMAIPFTVIDNRLRIIDPEFDTSMPPIPLKIPNGTFAFHTYIWNHPRRQIIVCALIQFRNPILNTIRPLSVTNPFREDLNRGIMVDSAEIMFESASVVKLQSGFGDGYYPAFVSLNFGLQIQSIIVDFQIDRIRNVIPFNGQKLDEYQIIYRDDEPTEIGHE